MRHIRAILFSIFMYFSILLMHKEGYTDVQMELVFKESVVIFNKCQDKYE